ncbi:hypothetical protein [Lactococcus ileimucosae]
MEIERLKSRVEKLEKKNRNLSVGLLVHDFITIALSIAVAYLFLG